MHITPWSDRLALDLALMLEKSGETPDEVCERHGIQKSDLVTFSNDPVFQRRVTEYRADVRSKGLTFRLKARAQAEELLETSWVLIHSPDTSPAVKADLIKSTVKWANLEPRGSEEVAAGGGGVSITINLGGEPVTMRHIESTVIQDQSEE